MGIVDSNIFVDHGLFGRSDPTIRPTYKAMLSRMENGDVDTVVFSEFSRLGRNAKESLYEILRLEHIGITVKTL